MGSERGREIYYEGHSGAALRIGVRALTGIIVLLLANRAAAQDAFQIHGFIQGRYTDIENTPDLLEVRRARVIVSGSVLTSISYKAQVDLVKKPYLMDASLTWKLSRKFSISAGQMKIPFGEESLVADNLNPPVARSRPVLALSPGRDTGVQARDVGAQASGSYNRGSGPLLEYAIGVFRGQTFVVAPKVHYNAVAGRVIAHPWKGTWAGADWYGSFSAPRGAVKRRQEVEFGYDRGAYMLRGEQLFARDGTLDRRGGYALAVRRFGLNWEALTRADWLTTDTHKPNTSSISYIVGGNRFWWRHIKVGLDGGAQKDLGRGIWSSVFYAQLMIFY